MHLPDAETFRGLWTLNPEVDFLNHGSFGSCPRAVLLEQQQWRDRMEQQPVRFFMHDLEGLLDDARAELGAFIGAPAEDLAWVSNATAGVATVLASLRLSPGDEILITSHEYGACKNAVQRTCERAGARMVVADVPFPLASPAQVIQAVLDKRSKKTRLVLVSHVTSPTGLVFPVRELVQELTGVDVLIDGAHAPGMVPLEVRGLGAAYYTGNCHKWLCAPKGAAFLYVRPDRQAEVAPLCTSHGMSSPRTDRSRFRLEHDWAGTVDPSAWLTVPYAIRFLGSLLPGGIVELMAHNHALALEGRDRLCAALGLPAPSPDLMIGSLATVPLPESLEADAGLMDGLKDLLLRRHQFEVPVFLWPRQPERLLRISAQLYNSVAQFQRLADVVQLELLAERALALARRTGAMHLPAVSRPPKKTKKKAPKRAAK